ncbi:transposase [Telmatocola sphagniphila]|uniref:Transposase n=1 Tax=Telmatocola sphagniphila TaxID=1123043 RepID=A0A8E6EUP8_9BACT|nr:transposase [Telmatocola sphagniphila]
MVDVFNQDDRAIYDSLPEFLAVRETRVEVKQAGFRTRIIIVASTLLDADEITKTDLAKLYRTRWNAELDLRSLKQTLQMDILRCKTLELVRKEIWTHILAYNLLRTIMAQAAKEHEIDPRSISFKGTFQTLEAFQQVIAMHSEKNSEFRWVVYQLMLDEIASHRVANRPNRYEPRRRKRRPKPYDRLMMPRNEAKRQLAKGVRDN